MLKSPDWVYFGGLAIGLATPSKNADKKFVPCSIDVEVREGAKAILFGVGTRGSGTVWVKGGTVQVVGD